MKKQIKRKLYKILEQQLGFVEIKQIETKDDIIYDDLNIKYDLGFDSLDEIETQMEIEDYFGISFGEDETLIGVNTTINEFMNLIYERIIILR